MSPPSHILFTQGPNPVLLKLVALKNSAPASPVLQARYAKLPHKLAYSHPQKGSSGLPFCLESSHHLCQPSFLPLRYVLRQQQPANSRARACYSLACFTFCPGYFSGIPGKQTTWWGLPPCCPP